MDIQEKNLITTLRRSGKSYTDIEKITGIRRETVGAFCRSNNIVPERPDFIDGICPECGKGIEQPKRGHHKTFCSESCRRSWWKKNRNYSNPSAENTHVIRCHHCGKEFISYKSDRKFCTHSCYIHSRFGADKDEQ